MARILLFFYGGNDVDLIECPQHIADNLKKYQRHFDKWVYDIKNNIITGKKIAMVNWEYALMERHFLNG